ncbi:MAG: DNA-processing protein DprA [Arachnia propionica]|uniref:DNA-processing protein DprA n=1 Tax=Arachnia propionica TaxID=1750 RepID=UPI0026FA65EF|nr:DNA-processing protein DprA [Arachnia propionica]
MDQERLARMALCALNQVADPRFTALVAQYGPEEVWQTLRGQGETTSLGRRALAVIPEALAEATELSGARFIIPGDDEWPPGLDLLDQARVGDMGGRPLGVWVSGPLSPPAVNRTIAVVGARAASGYGMHATQELAAGLAEAGWCIVSGMAFGIDAAAHRAALAVGGDTMAVMATGIDRTYPASHQVLRTQIEARGAVWTEMPPGQHPLRGSFLARNRIIAALGIGTVVVEAGPRSGARNTAAWTGELGRTLMAVPGPITSSLSVATHHMIRDGSASLVATVDDVVTLLAPLGTVDEKPLRGRPEPLELLRSELRAVREAVPSGGVAGAGELSAATGMAVPTVMAAAAELVELGWLEETQEGWCLPRRPV